MTNKRDGGPAFPAGGQQTGMSLRDYFAGQTLMGLMANPHTDLSSRETAEISYDIADAMLKAREG